MQAAGRNAAGALLVLLHLLEGQPELLGKRVLAHAAHYAAYPEPLANPAVNVLLVWRVHSRFPQCLKVPS